LVLIQRHAMSYLERYFYLIVFGAYLLATHPPKLESQSNEGETADLPSPPPSFSKWLQQHPHLFRLLDDLGGVRYKSAKVLEHCVVKMDHFYGIARLPFDLSENVLNFRRIGDKPIFGTAQCLELGIRDVIASLDGEFDRAIWINLREEAVIYVSGRPFVMRHREKLLDNVEYPGIEVDEITAIESQVKQEIQTEVRKANGLFMYWYEPRELESEETMEHINPEAEIKTLVDVYNQVAATSGFDLRYARIPVSDETAPEEKDLDDMVRLIAPAFMTELGVTVPGTTPATTARAKTAVICNCQMGRGRTTTALVCIYMLRVVLEGTGSSSAATASSQRRQSIALAAEYVVIKKLVDTLENGVASKQLVDHAVDQCEHMQNLRECIAECRDQAMDASLPSAKRDFFMLRAVNYLERYFYLICFASYLLEEREHLFRRTRFVAWMNTRYGSALYELLDNLCFEEEPGAETHMSSMRWRWRRKRKVISRLE
jgi:protein-tyrosine phosphatase